MLLMAVAGGCQSEGEGGLFPELEGEEATGGSIAVAEDPDRPVDRSERALVYAAALRDVHATDRVKRFVVDPTQIVYGPAHREAFGGLAQFDTLRADTRTHFLAASQQRGRLPARLPTGTPVVWLEAGEFASFEGDTEEGPWETFWTRYPAGSAYLGLSEVGFSEDRLQAVVLIASRAGMQAHSLDLALLERTPDGWRVIEIVSGPGA